MNSCASECKEYISLENADTDSLDQLNQIEASLSKTPFLNSDMITADDVTAFDEVESMNIMIQEQVFPKMVKWLKEVNRLKLNWKISKRPDKGRTFLDYIKKSQKKINEQKAHYEEKRQLQTNQSKDVLIKEVEEKEIATIHFHPKKMPEYQIKIKVKFLQSTDQPISLAEVASKLAIVTHTYLPNKTDVIPNKNEKDELSAEIISTIDKDDYDIEALAQDIKRNVNGVFNVEISSITKL